MTVQEKRRPKWQGAVSALATTLCRVIVRATLRDVASQEGLRIIQLFDGERLLSKVEAQAPGGVSSAMERAIARHRKTTCAACARRLDPADAAKRRERSPLRRGLIESCCASTIGKISAPPEVKRYRDATERPGPPSRLLDVVSLKGDRATASSR